VVARALTPFALSPTPLLPSPTCIVPAASGHVRDSFAKSVGTGRRDSARRESASSVAAMGTGDGHGQGSGASVVNKARRRSSVASSVLGALGIGGDESVDERNAVSQYVATMFQWRTAVKDTRGAAAAWARVCDCC
jgi:hypothetical protein